MSDPRIIDNPFKKLEIRDISRKGVLGSYVYKDTMGFWGKATNPNFIKEAGMVRLIYSKHNDILKKFFDRQRNLSGPDDSWLINYKNDIEYIYREATELELRDRIVPALTPDKNIIEAISRGDNLVGKTFAIYKVLSYLHTNDNGRIWVCECIICGSKHKISTKYLQKLHYEYKPKNCKKCYRASGIGESNKIIDPQWNTPKLKEWWKGVKQPFKLVVKDKKDNMFIATHIIGKDLYDAKKKLGIVKNFEVLTKKESEINGLGFYNDLKYD